MERQSEDPTLHLHAGESERSHHGDQLQAVRAAGGGGGTDLSAQQHAGGGGFAGGGSPRDAEQKCIYVKEVNAVRERRRRTPAPPPPLFQLVLSQTKGPKVTKFPCACQAAGVLLWFCDSVQSFMLRLEVREHERNNSSLIFPGRIATKTKFVPACVCVCVSLSMF